MESISSPSGAAAPPVAPPVSSTPFKPANGVISFSHSISVKLDNSNFLLWHQQIESAIYGYQLDKFIDLHPQIPQKFVSPADELSGKINDAFIDWSRQDRLLLSWILSSISESVLGQAVGCKTSSEAWHTIINNFASQTRARDMQLKTQLQNLKKGSQTMSEYLSKIKTITDSLANIGQPLAFNDHLNSIFRGLPSEYDPFICSMLTRTDSYKISDVHSLLLTQESRIDESKSSDIASANVAHTSNQYFNRGGPARGYGRNRTGGRGFNRGSGGRGYFPRGRGAGARGGGRFYSQNSVASNKSSLLCQVCGKNGHIASQCWYRYDSSYTIDPHSFSSNIASSSSSVPVRPAAPLPATPAQAMIATPHSVCDSSWYVDSGASNHLAYDDSYFSDRSSYGAPEQVFIGDGSSLSILSVGSSIFSTANSSQSFVLKGVLHVPSISKNLISVTRFSRDNNAYFVFFPDCFVVEQQVTHKILLQGTVRHGLYVLDQLQFSTPNHHSSFAFVSHNSDSSIDSFTLWHNRLGHPASRVVSSILQDCNIVAPNKKNLSVCKACCYGKFHKSPSPTSTSIYQFPLELIHTDLWGPAPVVSSSGFRYYVHFTDSCTRFCWMYLLKQKSDVFKAFLDFKASAELQLQRKILAVQSD